MEIAMIPRPHTFMPERFNCLESMLFATEPARAREAAQAYAQQGQSSPPCPHPPSIASLPRSAAAPERAVA